MARGQTRGRATLLGIFITAGLAAATPGALAGPTQTLAAAANPTPGLLAVQIVAQGLTNPRGLAFAPDGSLYVAEAGVGGTQLIELGRQKPHAVGRSGRLSRISSTGERTTVVDNLPSIVTAANEEVGPSGVTFLGEQLYLLTASGGWEIGDPEFHNGLFRLHLDGTLERIFDYSAYTREHPTRARLQDPRADVPLGMPFGLAALDGMLYSTDGNQEQILAITPAGEAARIVEYPMSNRALTGIVAGPDGALYVAEFAARKITRVQADGLISDALMNVRTPPVAAAFDRDGRLYVLEYYTGRVTRVAQLGDEQREVVAEGFPQASAMVLGPDGNLYISFHGGKAKTGEIQSQDGQIVRLALSSTVNVEPGPSAVALLLLLGALILLGTGALVVWQVRRSRA